MAECCGNCNAFRLAEGAPEDVGTCRAKSIVGFPMPVQVGSTLRPGGPQMAMTMQSGFPPTRVDSWCREWQPLPAAQNYNGLAKALATRVIPLTGS